VSRPSDTRNDRRPITRRSDHQNGLESFNSPLEVTENNWTPSPRESRKIKMLTMSRMRHEKGFTLIELLIVIVVLGILAAIVLFAVGSARDDANTSACAAEKKTIDTAEEAHKAKTGSYATSGSALVTAGFLKAAPTKYTVGGTSAAYTLTPVSPCT
jgi:prepilin-type N-terminal cleavage/methylation domain-containing protein